MALLAFIVLSLSSTSPRAEGIIVQGSVTSNSPDSDSYTRLEGASTVSTPETEAPESPEGPQPGGGTVGEESSADEESELDCDYEVGEDWECTDMGGGLEYCEPPVDSQDSDLSTSCGPAEAEGCASSRPSDLSAGAGLALIVLLVMRRRRRPAQM